MIHALALLATLAPAAAPNTPVRITLLQVETVGLARDGAAALRDHVTNGLRTLNVDVLPPGDKKLRKSCTKSAGCLRKQLRRLAVDGALLIEGVRVGPEVHLSVRLIAADTGLELRRARFTPPAERFPESWSPGADLEPMLEAFPEWRRPEAVAAMPESEPKEPGPDPDTVSALPPDITRPAPPAAESSALPLVLVISGGVATAAGGTLAILGRTTREDPTSTGDAKAAAEVYGPTGVALVGVGAGVAITGIVLWLLED